MSNPASCTHHRPFASIYSQASDEVRESQLERLHGLKHNGHCSTDKDVRVRLPWAGLDHTPAAEAREAGRAGEAQAAPCPTPAAAGKLCISQVQHGQRGRLPHPRAAREEPDGLGEHARIDSDANGGSRDEDCVNSSVLCTEADNSAGALEGKGKTQLLRAPLGPIADDHTRMYLI
jgi:hypothetical protein